jgi:hypothetical protein
MHAADGAYYVRRASSIGCGRTEVAPSDMSNERLNSCMAWVRVCVCQYTSLWSFIQSAFVLVWVGRGCSVCSGS